MKKKLADEKSPYLQKAARQKINWLPYCEEAFRKAKEEGKAVFLSSGAGWCHWCHVQAAESFEDPQVVEQLNKDFICIKIDRDLRPDIDRRYQEALAAMGHGGGWPLSIFLTPEGKPFYGGTYFPPVDSMGRPGFKKVLTEVSQFYAQNKEKAQEYSDRVIEHLRQGLLAKPEPSEKEKGSAEEQISASSLEAAVMDMLKDFDPRNGGFGNYPKFPMPGAIRFLSGQYFRDKNLSLGDAIKRTLTAMATGGVYDQIGGGFHRYSTDASWIIPHFEKMAEDNAWLLVNYLEGFHLFGEPLFKKTALGIIDFAKGVLSDLQGGFYSSQDADITPEDEGGYFTWTQEDFKAVLEGDELQVASLHFLHENGAMPHGEKKKHVLFIAMGPEEVAQKTGLDAGMVRSLIESAKGKLLAARSRRELPFVDKSLYSSVNGLFVSAYLYAWRVFGDAYLKDFALLSLNRMLKENLRDGILYRSGDVPGVLDDYAHMTGALLDAYENTGQAEFLEKAEGLALTLQKDFLDGQSGGFFDSREEVMGLKFRNVEDIPHPSANAQLIWHFLRLSAITGNASYMETAKGSLLAFADRAKGLGIHAGTYFYALDGFYNYMALNVEAAAESPLAAAARNVFRPHKIVSYGKDLGRVTPCVTGRCLQAVTDPGALEKVISSPSV